MAIKDILAKIAFTAKKKKPEIFMVVGVAGIIGGTVLCCKATLKTPDILEDHKAKREEIVKKAAENPVEYKPGKDLFKLYLQTTGRLLWNYKWGIMAEGFGLFCVGKGFGEEKDRLASTSAALAGTSAAFEEYRSRAKERFGDEVDRQLLTGESEMEITDIPAEGEVDENGKKKKVTKKKVTLGDPDATGDGYGRYITRNHPLFDVDEDYFLMNIRRVQNNCNDKKNKALSRSICLNEIYEELYFEKDKKGMIAGYIGENAVIEFDVKKVKLPDEFGTFHDAYWVGFKNLKKNIYDEMDI